LGLKNKLILSVAVATAATFLLPILGAQLGCVRMHGTMMAARRQGKLRTRCSSSLQRCCPAPMMIGYTLGWQLSLQRKCSPAASLMAVPLRVLAVTSLSSQPVSEYFNPYLFGAPEGCIIRRLLIKGDYWGHIVVREGEGEGRGGWSKSQEENLRVADGAPRYLVKVNR